MYDTNYNYNARYTIMGGKEYCKSVDDDGGLNTNVSKADYFY